MKTDEKIKKNEKMKFIDYVRPMLLGGKHTISVEQEVTAPEKESFTKTEDFYVAGRAYTLDINDVFNVSPTENECGDFSKKLPFITIQNKTFPWERIHTSEIDGKPVPWVALIVISSAEQSSVTEMSVSELVSSQRTNDLFFPDSAKLPLAASVTDFGGNCRVLEISNSLYDSIMPSYKDLTYLTHVKRIDLSDTEDSVAALDGDFSVMIANRFIPSGSDEKLQSTVHLVSMYGMPEKIPNGFHSVRLISLYSWKVFSVKDNSQAFTALIDGLENNTGVMGYNFQNETLKNGYVAKKHITRSGETTFSLYRSPFVPRAEQDNGTGSKYTADGHLIYNPDSGIMDTSYAAAFQLGRLLTLSRPTEAKKIVEWRNRQKNNAYKQQLQKSVKKLNAVEVCAGVVNDFSAQKTESEA